MGKKLFVMFALFLLAAAVYAALKSNGLTGFEDIKSLVLDCYYGFE